MTKIKETRATCKAYGEVWHYGKVSLACHATFWLKK